MVTKSADILFCIAVAVLSITLLPAVTMGYEKEIAALSENLKEQIQSSGKKKVAVVDFTNLQGSINELGRFLAEELSTGLLEAKGSFEVIDRSSLQALLKENKLSATGLIDPKDTQKIVKVSGVDALITGNITSSSDSMRLSVKILDAETAKMIGASKANIPATKFLKDLEEKSVFRNENGSAPDTGKTIAGTAANGGIKVEKRTEEKGITFELQRCQRKGKDVECDVLIINMEQDKEIKIFAKNNSSNSYYMDAKDTFYPKTIRVGTQEDENFISGIKLYKNIPVKLTLYFTETNSIYGVANLIVITCCLERVKKGDVFRFTGEGFAVKFENISISKVE